VVALLHVAVPSGAVPSGADRRATADRG
ncbi:uncharacterized protein METZ01_LOCUS17096, partial [marine metagenome]